MKPLGCDPRPTSFCIPFFHMEGGKPDAAASGPWCRCCALLPPPPSSFSPLLSVLLAFPQSLVFICFCPSFLFCELLIFPFLCHCHLLSLATVAPHAVLFIPSLCSQDSASPSSSAPSCFCHLPGTGHRIKMW